MKAQSSKVILGGGLTKTGSQIPFGNAKTIPPALERTERGLGGARGIGPIPPPRFNEWSGRRFLNCRVWGGGTEGKKDNVSGRGTGETRDWVRA